MRTRLLGVDTGGTFTDFVLVEADRLRIHKVLSTPAAHEKAILQGIEELGLNTLEQLATLTVVHGSTVATNAVLEGKGVRTAFITNRGLADMLTLGRQARAELYNLQPHPVPPPVPRALCLETGGRLAADGTVVEALSASDISELLMELNRLQPAAVAINLLFSYLDDCFEKELAESLPEELFISRSSEILPEFREYERGITTWLNAYVGPLVERYLSALEKGLRGSKLSIMQSAGGTMSSKQAGREAVHMLLSGPAGGLAGAKFIGSHAQRTRLLTFDMGGTSTDVALIDGDLLLTTEGRIGRFPVAVSMVDMHTIGAGGGSIANLDAGGLLHVGPQSAGADPGPACYGRGGRQATVTDANLVLGRLRADAFLGGHMTLDEQAAYDAVAGLASHMELDVEEAANGIVKIANEHMVRALRVMSVERGVDPRELTLVSFGGAGGLHVCALAEDLGMNRAMVPVHAGVLSALGMLVAPRARFLSRTNIALLSGTAEPRIKAMLQELSEAGCQALQSEGVAADDIQQLPSLDLRYRGQSYFLNVPWMSIPASEQAFHELHQSRYGHRMELPVEMVNVRLVCRGPAGEVVLDSERVEEDVQGTEMIKVYGINDPVAQYPRTSLGRGQEISGPALVTEKVATTWLAPGWCASVNEDSSLLLERR